MFIIRWISNRHQDNLAILYSKKKHKGEAAIPMKTNKTYVSLSTEAADHEENIWWAG